jgi:hypothetical protein
MSTSLCLMNESIFSCSSSQKTQPVLTSLHYLRRIILAVTILSLVSRFRSLNSKPSACSVFS